MSGKRFLCLICMLLSLGPYGAVLGQSESLDDSIRVLSELRSDGARLANLQAVFDNLLRLNFPTVQITQRRDTSQSQSVTMPQNVVMRVQFVGVPNGAEIRVRGREDSQINSRNEIGSYFIPQGRNDLRVLDQAIADIRLYLLGESGSSPVAFCLNLESDLDLQAQGLLTGPIGSIESLFGINLPRFLEIPIFLGYDRDKQAFDQELFNYSVAQSLNNFAGTTTWNAGEQVCENREEAAENVLRGSIVLDDERSVLTASLVSGNSNIRLPVLTRARVLEMEEISSHLARFVDDLNLTNSESEARRLVASQRERWSLAAEESYSSGNIELGLLLAAQLADETPEKFGLLRHGYSALGDFESANLFQREDQQGQVVSLDNLLLEVEQWVAQEELEEAISLITSNLYRFEPVEVRELRMRLGDLYEYNDELEDAKTQYQLVLAEEENTVALYRLGVIAAYYENQPDYGTAIDYLDRALRVDPLYTAARVEQNYLLYTEAYNLCSIGANEFWDACIDNYQKILSSYETYELDEDLRNASLLNLIEALIVRNRFDEAGALLARDWELDSVRRNLLLEYLSILIDIAEGRDTYSDKLRLSISREPIEDIQWTFGPLDRWIAGFEQSNAQVFRELCIVQEDMKRQESLYLSAANFSERTYPCSLSGDY